MTRVQIPAYTDAWMKGDRYGELVKIFTRRSIEEGVDKYAIVLLDKSGKRACVLLDDCEVVS